MGLAHKLYKIGSLLSDDDVKAMIKSSNFKDSDHITLAIDFKIENGRLIGAPKLSRTSLDTIKTFFTKKIGGTSNSYYLYPNYEYQNEKDLYKKFQAISHTLQNSIVVYANSNNKILANLVFEYLENYKNDELGLKDFKQGDYFLILLINGKSFYELMPEVLQNYLNEFVKPHIEDKKGNAFLKEQIDIVTQEKEPCGYDPNVKFFTMDNYDDKFKEQSINRLPMSKNTAKSVKKGWMYAINNLKFYYKGLEYIIIPSMVNFDEDIFKEMINFLEKSNTLSDEATREESFIRKLNKQIENFEYINSFTLDIFFTEVNVTNLSVKIFATLEDVLPSRIRKVANLMQEDHITDAMKRVQGEDEDIRFVYLKDYFRVTEQFAISTNSIANLKNKILQEKIYLARLLLGYLKISYLEVLKRFEHFREFDGENKSRLKDSIKEWIMYPNTFIENENKVLKFLKDINAIRM